MLIFLASLLFQRKVKENYFRSEVRMCQGNLPIELGEKRCIFFLRNAEGVIPTFSTLQEAEESMPAFLEFGVLNGHTLLMLEQITLHVRMIVVVVAVVLLFSALPLVPCHDVCLVHFNIDY